MLTYTFIASNFKRFFYTLQVRTAHAAMLLTTETKRKARRRGLLCCIFGPSFFARAEKM